MFNALSRRTFLLALAAASALAFGAAEPVAGRDYKVLAPAQPTATPGKIEVIEFFWYGCPHCNHYEPFIERWAKTLPKDAAFRREHALFSGRESIMKGHAQLFLALKSLGKQDELAQRVFDAVHKDHVELRDEATAIDWAVKQGIKRDAFVAAYKSFGMDAMLAQAAERSEAYQLDGVPTFVVDGKYAVQATEGDEDGQRMFGVINALIVKERKAHGK